VKPSLVVVVMAHPSRRAAAELLAEAVQADDIVWDVGAGEWDTAERAWRAGRVLAVQVGASHVLVIQDDAIPVDHLREHVLEALDAAPSRDAAVSLYLGKVKPSRWVTNVEFAVRLAEREGCAWLRSTHLLHGVAVVLPAHVIDLMLKWCSRPSMPYDERIGAWIRQVWQKPTYYTVPSLVDHDDELATLVVHADDVRLSPKGRVAWRYGVAPDWATMALDIATPEGART
jgi:hypothetical protein